MSINIEISPSRFTSPLRYPGGKRNLSPFFKALIIENSLLRNDYIEIYAGGASIGLSLLFDGFVQHIHINDISKPIYAFWKSVVDFSDELCRLIQDTQVTLEEWRRQKDIQENFEDFSLLKLGFSTFFLNRSNYSGILNGGVIGGNEQKGDWSITSRFNKDGLIRRIQRIADYSNQISLYNCDAGDFIQESLPNLPAQSLVYLDPPYYVKGKGLYEDHYTYSDHVFIASLVSSQLHHPWVVSYDNVPEITNLYNGYRHLDYNLNYCAQERYVGSEVMFFSDNLTIPIIKNVENKIPHFFYP